MFQRKSASVFSIPIRLWLLWGILTGSAALPVTAAPPASVPTLTPHSVSDSPAYSENSLIVGRHSTLIHRLLLEAGRKEAGLLGQEPKGEERLQRPSQEGDEGLPSAILSPDGQDARAIGKAAPFADEQAAIVPRYRITDLGTLGGTQSFAYGINDQGQIVGYSWLPGDADGHAFLYDQGKMIDLSPFQLSGLTGGLINNKGQIAGSLVVDGIDSPAIFDSKTHQVRPLGTLGGNTDGFNGSATSINDFGQAVGYSYLATGTRHAFLYSQGSLIDIDSFGGYSVANAINNIGMIAGFASDRENGTAHAFLYTAGAMLDIDPWSAADFSHGESYARDINNQGHVVGEFLMADGGAFHAFLYNAGAFTDLGKAGSPETSALAINEQGQIVGITFVPYKTKCYDENSNQFVPCIKYKQHAFFYEKGRRTDLNKLIQPGSGWELTWALDLNDHGQIVGYGVRQGHFRAFLLTPTTFSLKGFPPLP